MALVATNTKPGFTPEEMAEMESPAEETAEPESNEPKPEPAKPAAKTETPDKAGKPPAGFVPQSALHEAREETKRLKEQNQRFEQMWQRIQTERAENERKAKEQAELAKIPDFQSDPAGHLVAQIGRLQQELSDLRAQGTRMTEAQTQSAQTNDMINRYAQAVGAYARTEDGKDFQEAYDFLSKHRDAELAMTPGYADPIARANRLQYEEGLIVGQALLSGQNPAQILHDLAKYRGYKRAEAPDPNAATKIEQLARGQKAAKTLNGGANSGTNTEVMSIEHLIELEDSDPDAAAAMWEKMRKRGLLG